MLDRDALLIDLKGAARLGYPEALDLALEGLLGWKSFAANARLKDEDVAKVLVPLGEVLATPTVPADYLLALARHPLAGKRALAAVALGLRALRGEKNLTLPLTRLAGDRRAEVRFALVTALGKHGEERFPFAQALLEHWLEGKRSPRVLATALQTMAVLAQTFPAEVLALADRLTLRQISSPEIQRPLVEVLKRVATYGTEEAKMGVLGLMAAWVQEDGAGAAGEIALRVLHAPWARQLPGPTLDFLNALEAFGGPRRLLRRTMAFIRTGAAEQDET